MRRLSISLLLACLVGGSAPVAAGEVSVEVGHGTLKPAELSISVGDTLTFHNAVAMPGGHTIVSEDGWFRSLALGKDESWSHTFDAPGTWRYYIAEHPDAKGEIRVE